MVWSSGVIAKSTSGNWTYGFGLAGYNGVPEVHFYVNYYSGDEVMIFNRVLTGHQVERVYQRTQ